MRKRRIAKTAAVVMGVMAGVGGASGAGTLPGGGAEFATRVVPGLDFVPEVSVDEAALAQAAERGAALLKGARWEAPAPIDIVGRPWTLYDAGHAVIWSFTYPLEDIYGTGNAAVAVDKATGKPLWPATTGINIMAVSAVAKGDEMAVFRWTGGMDGGRTGSPKFAMEMVGVADLAKRWATPVALYSDAALIAGTQVFTGASVPGMNVTRYAGSAGSRAPVRGTSLTLEMEAYDRETGKQQWHYKLPAETLSARPRALAEGVLYVVAMSSPDPKRGRKSTLIALSAAEGKELFAVRSQGNHKDGAGNMQEEQISSVVVKEGVVVAASSSGEVVGFDAKTGQEKWRQMWRGPEWASAKQPGQALVLKGVRMEKEELVALATGSRTGYVGVNLKTGKLDWLVPATGENARNAAMPVVSDGVMYMVKEGKLMAVPVNQEDAK